jgi:hypothetical protein
MGLSGSGISEYSRDTWDKSVKGRLFRWTITSCMNAGTLINLQKTFFSNFYVNK